MSRQVVDPRVRTLIENGVKLGHRSLFVVVGEYARDQVPNLHFILSNAMMKARPSVLWCYKDELGFSSHRKKRMNQIKSKIAKGLMESVADDPFELFISSTDIRYTYYHESHTILGKTFGMLVLQDFEALTPNMLARTVETVAGGGMVVLLLSSLNSLKALHSLVLDSHAKYKTSAIPRFNRRFVALVNKCRHALVLDDRLQVVPGFCKHSGLENIESMRPQEALRLDSIKNLVEKLEGTGAIQELVKLCFTEDQAKTVLALLDSISGTATTSTSSIVSVTAARGRGKSAAMGLAVAGAISLGYSFISVTAPSPENLTTFFEFVVKGLIGIGFIENSDFSVSHLNSEKSESNRKTSAVIGISVFKSKRQSIKYVHPSKVAETGSDLVIIDEAAAIPLPLVKKAIKPSLSSERRDVFLSSTVSGYEGTGRSLSLKLLAELRNQADNSTFKLNEIEMIQPIRYSLNDPIEAWLYDLLVFNATIKIPPVPEALPSLNECNLYLVNRDVLFSGVRCYDAFLRNVYSVLIAAHYRNSPDELALLADSPSHRLLVLMPTITRETRPDTANIIAVLHVALEGQINKEEVHNQLVKGERKDGDLIPWTLARNFLAEDFPQLSGLRVVRLAVHPSLMGLKYGTRVLSQLQEWLEGKLLPNLDRPQEVPFVDSADGNGSEFDPSSSPTLLSSLSDLCPWRLHWIGSSFGLSCPLLRFWKNSGYNLVHTRLSSSDVTGEHSGIVLKAITSRPALPEETVFIESNKDFLEPLLTDFKRRISVCLGAELSEIPVDLALEVVSPDLDPTIDGKISTGKFLDTLNERDLLRISNYARNLADKTLIADLIPFLALSWLRFELPIVLTAAQASVLISHGLQRKSVSDISRELSISTQQTITLLNKVLRKLAEYIRNSQTNDLLSNESNLPVPSDVSTLEEFKSEIQKAGREEERKLEEVMGIVDVPDRISLKREGSDVKEKKERGRKSSTLDDDKRQKRSKRR
ncbi:hypothetical protein RCL1_005549 [Eukaryota sp. TZLM3-RCL]